MSNLFTKKNALAAAAGVAAIFSVASANAALNPAAFVWSLGGNDLGATGIFSTHAGANTITFDSPIPSGVTIVGGGIVSGNVAGSYAPPSGDTSSYFSAGTTALTTDPATITFSKLQNYFGFDFSSPDSYNTIDFYNGATLVASYNGTDLANLLGFPAAGQQTASYYLNVDITDGTVNFDKVVLGSSGQNAFEIDNLATAAVPEPEIYAMMGLGLGMMGFIARRRKQIAA